MSSQFGVPLCKNLWMVWDFASWQFNKLACHRFMDAGRRQKTSELETKDSLLLTATGSLLLTSKAAAKVLAFLHQVLSPGFCRAVWRVLGDIHTPWKAWQDTGFGTLNLLWSISVQAICPRGRHYQTLLRRFAIQASLKRAVSTLLTNL